MCVINYDHTNDVSSWNLVHLVPSVAGMFFLLVSQLPLSHPKPQAVAQKLLKLQSWGYPATSGISSYYIFYALSSPFNLSCECLGAKARQIDHIKAQVSGSCSVSPHCWLQAVWGTTKCARVSFQGHSILYHTISLSIYIYILYNICIRTFVCCVQQTCVTGFRALQDQSKLTRNYHSILIACPLLNPTCHLWNTRSSSSYHHQGLWDCLSLQT